jgi:hypothetical protein
VRGIIWEWKEMKVSEEGNREREAWDRLFSP